MSDWREGVRRNIDRLLLAAALLGGAIIAARAPVVAAPAAYLAGSAGLVAIHERLRSEFSRHVAFTTTLLLFAGTSLFWSMTRAGSVPEAISFGLVAALVFTAQRLRSGRLAIWSLVAVLPIVIQVLVARREAGDVAATPWPWLADLFSSSHGLLSLTPVAYVALVGSIFYLRRDRFAAAAAIAVFLLWIAGRAVFGRALPTDTPFDHGLTSMLALLAPGLALVVQTARSRPLLAVAPLIAGALLWNYWLMVQYTIGTLPKDAPVSFASMVRQQAEVSTRAPYVYPFAFPGNLWFALRERVPIDRYEVLAGQPRQASVDLVLDRHADRFLLEGWDAPGVDTLGPVRWIGEQRATVALPLAAGTSRAIVVVVTARARLEEPAVNAELGVELNGHDLGRFIAPPSALIEARLTIPADSVGRILRAGYNRLTFVSHGVHRIDPQDDRQPGPLASRPGARAWPVAIHRIRIAPE